jgi:hypothetical protein
MHSQTTWDLHAEDGAVHTVAAEAYRAAAARDPRRFPFGYLAADPTGAPGAFVWFPTAEQLVGCLVDTEVALLRFDADESAVISASLRRAIGSTRDVARLDRHAISAAFMGWCEILWVGTLADLCTRGGMFQAALRADFRSDLGLGEHGGPIADDEVERFVAYLASGAAGL